MCAKASNRGQGPDEKATRVGKEEEQSDLTDSKRDQERLKPDEAIIDLPELRDIPGQEHIHVPPLGELADTTISSDDEEGKGLLDDEDEGEDSNISE